MAIHKGSVTANTSKYGAYISIYEVTNSVDIANNTSKVTVELHITRSNWGWQTSNSYSGSITIDGQTRSFSYSPNWSYSSSGDVIVGSFTATVKHNDDGAKWCNGSATWNTSGTYSCGTASASGGVTLTTIPRATACPNLDGYIESSANITLNPASSSFKHRLYYSYNGKTGYYPSSTGFFANTGSLDLDKTFYDYTPKSSGTGSLTLYTYNSSGTQIGSKTGTITIRCDADKCRPTITATIVDSNSTTTALTGDSSKLIKGYSNAKITYTITTKNSATLSSKKINGSTLGTSPYTINKVTTGSFSIVATDSRGFSTTLEKKNTLINYIPLALNFNAFRPTPTGSEIKINFTGNYFNGTFGSVANTLALSWKYRILRTSEWTDGGTFVAGTDYTISGNRFYSGTGSSASDISLGTDLFPYNQAYEIGIFYKDKLVDTFTTKPVPQGRPVLSWEDELVNVNGNLDINGDIKQNGESILVKNIETDKSIATNEYRNGKRIYKRFVECGAMSGTSLTISHGINNFDSIWIDTGDSYCINTGGVTLPLPFISSSGADYSVQVTLSGSGTNISINAKNQPLREIYVMLKYTKQS